MKMKSLFTVIVFLFLSIAVNNTYSQTLFKINEDIGGGGNTNTNVSESNDNTMLYIVGGAVVAGIVVYALLKDKKEKPKDDTTAVGLDKDFIERQLTLTEQIQNSQSQIPINLSLGIQNDLFKKDEKRYFIGLAFNF